MICCRFAHRMEDSRMSLMRATAFEPTEGAEVHGNWVMAQEEATRVLTG